MLEMESSFLSELHRDSYGQQQCSGMQSAPSEQMQGCSSLSLPPGLYTPHMPDILASPQTPMQPQHLTESQRSTYGTWYSMSDSVSTSLCRASNTSILVEGSQALDAEAQYFLSAQTKLRARQERLEAERVLQLSMAQQQQQQQQMVHMQLQVHLRQQLPIPPPPGEPVCEPQVTHLASRHTWSPMSLRGTPYTTLIFWSLRCSNEWFRSRLVVVCIVVSACTGVCTKGPLLCWVVPSVPENCFLSAQGVHSSFASPVAQRYADREELGSDDSEDTAVMTPTRNLQAMPTVAEDLSQELPPESYEDLRKAEGMLGGLWIAYRKAQLHPSL